MVTQQRDLAIRYVILLIRFQRPGLAVTGADVGN
jgi:hypothetical protein